VLVRTGFLVLPPSLMWENSCSSEAACRLWTLSFIVQREVKECGGVKVQLHPFLTLSVDGGEWWGSHPGSFYTRESAPCTIWYESGWLQSRSELFGEEVHPLPLSGIEPRFLGRPSRSLRTVPKVVPQACSVAIQFPLDGPTERRRCPLKLYPVYLTL